MKKYTFKKHKFKVQCKCGWEKDYEDDVYATECVLVKISHCSNCCPNCEGRATTLLYDKDGNRLV